MSDKQTSISVGDMINAILTFKPRLPDFDAILQRVEKIAKEIDPRLTVKAGQVLGFDQGGKSRLIDVFVESRYLKYFVICIQLSGDGNGWGGSLALSDKDIKDGILKAINLEYNRTLPRS